MASKAKTHKRRAHKIRIATTADEARLRNQQLEKSKQEFKKASSLVGRAARGGVALALSALMTTAGVLGVFKTARAQTVRPRQQTAQPLTDEQLKQEVAELKEKLKKEQERLRLENEAKSLKSQLNDIEHPEKKKEEEGKRRAEEQKKQEAQRQKQEAQRVADQAKRQAEEQAKQQQEAVKQMMAKERAEQAAPVPQLAAIRDFNPRREGYIVGIAGYDQKTGPGWNPFGGNLAVKISSNGAIEFEAILQYKDGSTQSVKGKEAVYAPQRPGAPPCYVMEYFKAQSNTKELPPLVIEGPGAEQTPLGSALANVVAQASVMANRENDSRPKKRSGLGLFFSFGRN